MSLRKTALGVLACLGWTVSLTSRAEAQVAFVPVVQPFQNGVNLDVTPVVSHDRRYVRLSLNFQSTAIEGFDRFSIPAAVGGTGNGGGFGGGGRGAGGGGGGGAGRLGARFDQPTGKSPWGNAQAPVAVAKGPGVSLDFPEDLHPATPVQVAVANPKPKGPLLAQESMTRRTRSYTAARRK